MKISTRFVSLAFVVLAIVAQALAAGCTSEPDTMLTDGHATPGYQCPPGYDCRPVCPSTGCTSTTTATTTTTHTHTDTGTGTGTQPSPTPSGGSRKVYCHWMPGFVVPGSVWLETFGRCDPECAMTPRDATQPASQWDLRCGVTCPVGENLNFSIQAEIGGGQFFFPMEMCAEGQGWCGGMCNKFPGAVCPSGVGQNFCVSGGVVGQIWCNLDAEDGPALPIAIGYNQFTTDPKTGQAVTCYQNGFATIP